jgi:3-phosphoshikimate 1-carboxyvinyltransferase
MFAPIAALSGKECVLLGEGSLCSRPIGMVEAPLRELGASISTERGLPPIRVKGPLQGGEVEVDGASSSQFLTGLLMALPLCRKDSVIRVAGLKSRPYVRMTLSLLTEFGIAVRHSPGLDRFEIAGSQSYQPTDYFVEGDWSGASFLLVAGAIAGSVSVGGLDEDSLQADRAILDALRAAGASVEIGNGVVTVGKGKLRGFEFDATDCPDLFPPLAALACSCKGENSIRGASRLSGKESDRGAALAQELSKMGADIRLEGDCLKIRGGKLRGGKADSHNDHRIAMACAVAALDSENGVEIKNDKCVSKSYPGFFGDLEKLRVKTW